MKVYLLLVLFTFCMLNAHGQLTPTYTLAVAAEGISVTSTWDGNWTTVGGSWISSAPPDQGTGTIVIPKGATWIIAETFRFNGRLEIYGTVIFQKNNNEMGRLVMDISSEIWIAKDGNVDATADTPNNNDEAGINSTWIEIGGQKLNGTEINTVQDPDLINHGTIRDGTSCANNPGCTFIPLPVELLYFTATPQKTAVKIDWASSKAWDFSHYELERSADGISFDYLSTIDAEENSDWIVYHSYTDRQPLNGISYYRLKAVDVDGRFEYKGIEVVQFAGAATLKVYPNPSNRGILNVQQQEATGRRVNLKDNSGRTVYAGTMEASVKTINTSSLQPGMYVLTVESTTGVQKKHVIIQ